MVKIYGDMHLVTEFFHSLPHLNMWFLQSNSTFDPNNSDYLETILFWTTVPILILIFILLILIIYACCLVCISNTASIKVNQSTNATKKKTNLNKYKTFVWIFIILLSSLLGLLVYGSENFHYSFKNATHHVQNFSEYFLKIGQQTKNVQASIKSHINNTLAKFEFDLKNSSFSNLKQKNDALKELASIRSALYDSHKSLEYLKHFENEKASYANFLQQTDMFETIRWSIMLGFVIINTFLILLLMIGLIKNSKASLCFFAFSGVLSLISIWILNAFYLGVTVFIADYCVSPDQYITTVAEKKHIKNIVQYFTTCQTQNKFGQTGKFIPFKQDLNRAESKLRTAAILYSENLIKISQSILGEQLIESYNFTDALLHTENLIDSLRLYTKCDQTSSSYKEIVNILCYNSIFNLAIIIASSISFGLLIPILICLIPQMWRKMNNKAYYAYNCGLNTNATEETHPFITLANGNTSQVRTNISAARQFNESPSFQRLVTNALSETTMPSNVTQQQNAVNTLSRNRYNTINNRAQLANHHQNMNRVDDCMINTDPYLTYKGAQTMSHNNYSQSNYGNYSNYGNGNYGSANTSAVNVPIVLYPNSSNGTRTLLMPNKYNNNPDNHHKNHNYQ